MLPPQRKLSVRTRVAIAPRDLDRFPLDDDALGSSLMGLVEGVITDRGALPRPVVLALRPEQIEQYELKDLLGGGADVHRFISAVAGQPGVEAVALLGVVGVRFGRGGVPTPAAVSFVEWPDCRWWSAVRPLEDRSLRSDWPAIQRAAVDGYPRPGGMGAWFSRARRERLQLRVASRSQPGLGMVH